jgi:bifunctional NMN adenylyltransferase/nudix hydrolase
MNKKYDYLLYIGRFSPCHSSHIQTIREGLKIANTIIVLIGSAGTPRTIKNPFTAEEREEMISSSLTDAERKRVGYQHLYDFTYNEQKWVKQVQSIVSGYNYADETTPSIGIIGHSKDESSYYLKMFPQWDFIDVGNINDLHATDIRTMMFELRQLDQDKIPKGIFDYLNAFMLTDEFEKLSREYEFIQSYKKSWANAPYPPIFVTADAVVIQSGHVLLIKRRAEPGKNLWAIPGGFVNANERVEYAALRELREETKLKVPEPVLRGNIKIREVYDAPDRSLRGRTITHAIGIELPAGPLPKVKGSDDAEKAKWIPLSVFEKMRSQMFEDHYSIVMDMIEKCN